MKQNSKNNIKHYLNKIPTKPKSLFLTPTNKSEIINLINQLPNNFSKGYDELFHILLKKLHQSISTLLEIIFNKSLKEGKFTSAMKL